VPGVPDLIEDLGFVAPEPGEYRPTAYGRPPAASPGAVIATLGSAEAQVARAVQPGARTLDELVASTGLAPAALLAVLTRLEGRGLVVPALGRYAPAGGLAVMPSTPGAGGPSGRAGGGPRAR
jgi:predicted Rossmann fold nucleotide-binding protein DprA/Smf involved in DNA uptake